MPALWLYQLAVLQISYDLYGMPFVGPPNIIRKTAFPKKQKLLCDTSHRRTSPFVKQSKLIILARSGLRRWLADQAEVQHSRLCYNAKHIYFSSDHTRLVENDIPFRILELSDSMLNYELQDYILEP